MTSEIELDDMVKHTTPQPVIVEHRRGGRLNLDANQEQAVTLWAYASTTMCVHIFECAPISDYLLAAAYCY